MISLLLIRYEKLHEELMESVVLYNLDNYHSPCQDSVKGLFFRDVIMFSNRTKSVNVDGYVTRFDYLKARPFANMGLGHGYSLHYSILDEHMIKALV